MEIARRFARALADDSAAGSGDPGLLPVRLVRAAAASLPVTGAGLSLHEPPDLRTPLAASSDVASDAERWQFTAGQGPCLHAATTTLPVFGTEDLLRRRWPVYHDLLVTKTPLRGVLALPLPDPLGGVGVLDLFFTDPAGPAAVDLVAARTVARLLTGWLVRDADWSVPPSEEAPVWVHTPAAAARARLWMAVGMVSLALRVPAPDALALLRGYAYAHDRAVDDVGADLVARRISPDRIGPIADGGR